MARKSLEKLEQEHSCPQDQPAPEQPEQKATEDEAAETIADIAKLLLQQEDIRNSRSYRENNLYDKITELGILAKRHSRANALATVCKSAKKEAEALYESTGSAKYEEIVDHLSTLEETLEMRAGLENWLIQMQGKSDQKADPDAARDMPTVDELSQIQQNINDALAVSMVQESMQATFDAIEEIAVFLKSETYKAIKENVSKLSESIAEDTEEIETAENEAATETIRQLIPFIKEELEWMKTDPTLQDYSVADILKSSFDAYGNQIESPFWDAIERAKERKAEFEKAQEIMNTVGPFENLPRIISNPTDLLAYPLDKPNSKIWNLMTAADPNGQLSLNIVTSKKGSKQDAIVYCAISFDELGPDVKLTKAKTLTPYDKRVYSAAAALFNGGNHVISATQIYKMMGNRGQPTAEQIQKINSSLDKMGAAHIYIDNTQEVQVNKNYGIFKYDASLLPFEREKAYINNTLTEAAIHLFREPPLITFARERGQVTCITRQLLESPISKTDANLQLEDYLLERIGHMKNPKSHAPRKMLFSTIYGRCNITSRNQCKRAPVKISRYLDHYKECGWIAGYTMDEDGVTIQL